MKTKIPQSIRGILDIFIRSNFIQYPYKTIANKLELKIDTLIQRISRNKEYFDIDNSQKPSRISIEKGIAEVYFYRDKNRCQLCQKIVEPERLTLRFRNPYQEDKYNWNNVLSVCDECKDKKVVKKVKQVKKTGLFEYKEVYMSLIYSRNRETDEYISYYEFDELDGSGSFPLIGEDNEIASNTIADIFNYYGADSWEVIHIEEVKGEYDEGGDYRVFFKRKREEGLN